MRISDELYTTTATNPDIAERQRYIVVFGKNAIDLEEKLNDAHFVPTG